MPSLVAERNSFLGLVPKLLICTSTVFLSIAPVSAFEQEFKPIFDTSCIACHSNQLMSPLDLKTLGYDLADARTYRQWERVYDRLIRGDMPPAPMPKLESKVLQPVLDAMKVALTDASNAMRGPQRAPLRRLTRLEYQYTIADLLDIDPDQVSDLIASLPVEADSGRFDTVAATQGISALHVSSYLDAADKALDVALQIGPRPESIKTKIEYAKSPYIKHMSDAKILGGGITLMLPDAAATFFDTVSTYIFHTGTEGVSVPAPGRYRVQVEAYPYQPVSTVTLTLFKGTAGTAASAALTDLIGVFDLADDEPRLVEVTTYLRPGDVVTPSVADVRPPSGPYVNYYLPERNVRDYRGEGIAMRSLELEGPLLDEWPPRSVARLLGGIEVDNGEIQLTKSPLEHIQDVISDFAPRAFRRPLHEGETEAFVALAKPILDSGRPFLDGLRVSLRAILTSPSFLFHTGSGDLLDDHGVASRLSYFLWRSMPDDELLEAAASDRLTEVAEIRRQIDRMLADPKAERFVADFTGQAFRLYEINTTTPDAGLYPEYDERLGQAMVAETQLFLAELIKDDLGVRNLIDADFTYLNRRLAEHYKIRDVEGQFMRKVELPADSVRGGLLTHASIHKITANGTTTSPVPRGNFVLANILGQPAPPPPPNIAGLEPDTRGTTTIREQLDAHRSNPICASCHVTIDPPGLAMESFDPIGGFRSRYRAEGEKVLFEGEYYPGPYKIGLPVDASGTTPEGVNFAGFEEYQRILVDTKLKQIARHVISQMIVLATGAEVEFADRDDVEQIVSASEANDFGLRSMIYEVATSELFKRR